MVNITKWTEIKNEQIARCKIKLEYFLELLDYRLRCANYDYTIHVFYCREVLNTPLTTRYTTNWRQTAEIFSHVYEKSKLEKRFRRIAIGYLFETYVVNLFVFHYSERSTRTRPNITVCARKPIWSRGGNVFDDLSCVVIKTDETNVRLSPWPLRKGLVCTSRARTAFTRVTPSRV